MINNEEKTNKKRIEEIKSKVKSILDNADKSLDKPSVYNVKYYEYGDPSERTTSRTYYKRSVMTPRQIALTNAIGDNYQNETKSEYNTEFLGIEDEQKDITDEEYSKINEMDKKYKSINIDENSSKLGKINFKTKDGLDIELDISDYDYKRMESLGFHDLNFKTYEKMNQERVDKETLDRKYKHIHEERKIEGQENRKRVKERIDEILSYDAPEYDEPAVYKVTFSSKPNDIDRYIQYTDSREILTQRQIDFAKAIGLSKAKIGELVNNDDLQLDSINEKITDITEKEKEQIEAKKKEIAQIKADKSLDKKGEISYSLIDSNNEIEEVKNKTTKRQYLLSNCNNTKFEPNKISLESIKKELSERMKNRGER